MCTHPPWPATPTSSRLQKAATPSGADPVMDEYDSDSSYETAAVSVAVTPVLSSRGMRSPHVAIHDDEHASVVDRWVRRGGVAPLLTLLG